MTYARANPPTQFAKRAFARTRTADTFPPELVELARKMGIGKRIAEARERSRWTQENVATHLGITTRGYQKVEEKGTTSFERCQQLADFFEIPGVTAEWLWDGAGPGPTPDLMGVFSEGARAEGSDLDERLEWIEGALQALLADRGLEHDAPPSSRDRPQRSDSSGEAPRS